MQFVTAWTHGDYVTMYSGIDASSQRATSITQFEDAYKQALTTATATGTTVAGKVASGPDGARTVPVRVYTRLFGALSLDFTMQVSESAQGGPRVAWSPSLAFPGLRPGEVLLRDTALPRRATVLARDGSVLAESPPGAPTDTGSQAGETTRSSPLGDVADAVLGTIGPLSASSTSAPRRQELEAQGVPGEAAVGVSGLELALDDRLRGTPGGELMARNPDSLGPGRRVLAYAPAHPAPPLRSTVSPVVQRAAVLALGDQLGGIVALQPSTGQILAVAGIGLDGLQPPGSTFKMITLTGVLAAKIATPHTVFPYATFATLDGVKLNNANGEECGGTLELAFAVSCNSVFTPLGVKLGAARLVAMAERFGFNHEPGVVGASESTLPAASEIQGELDVGSTAIGQGQVLATPLEMATVAATIADDGRRPQPTFLLDAAPAAQVPVMSASVARTVRHLMIGVVREGTGTSAAIPGVTVAGKTGTAELKTVCTSSKPESGAAQSTSESAPSGEGCQSAANEASNTDAWFAAFAPAIHPRIAVCVMLVKDGAGGATAAPIAREVLEAGLQAIH
ncbi:MAG TPA: penicillin-binding transpeptidase domain-containing protein [Solirubrobacteraceae bacterium]|nr:penicillin-binding transpeptidase domain-containing protein [Solirubrobacteraceae bacterium]